MNDLQVSVLSVIFSPKLLGIRKHRMLLPDMQMELGQGYVIYFKSKKSEVDVSLRNGESEVATASLVTDSVDVICVTKLWIDDVHVHRRIDDEHELGDAFVKALTKFPCLVRKPEFVFVMEVPENLKVVFDKRKFREQDDVQIQDGVLIRKEAAFPEKTELNGDFKIHQVVGASLNSAIFQLLKNNAYWQKNLTLERMALLIENSMCFVVSHNNEVVGFARVLNDERAFASLWDVVVANSFRNKGVGTALMHHIFSCEALRAIDTWILFTDTAKSLYQKFGFVVESELPQPRLIYKLRMQDRCPPYAHELMKELPQQFPRRLSMAQSSALLFGRYKKRGSTVEFLREVVGKKNK